MPQYKIYTSTSNNNPESITKEVNKAFKYKKKCEVEKKLQYTNAKCFRK